MEFGKRVISRIVELVKGKDPCMNCPLSWEERGPEDIDAGCHVGLYLEDYYGLPCLRSDRWKNKKLEKIREEQDEEAERWAEYAQKQDKKRQVIIDVLRERIDSHRLVIMCKTTDLDTKEESLCDVDLERELWEAAHDVLNALDNIGR